MLKIRKCSWFTPKRTHLLNPDTNQGIQNENCLGDQVFRSKNVQHCFDVQESQDMKFCHRIYNGPNSDCYDLNEYGMNIQKVYEGVAVGINANQIMSCIFTNEQVSDISYSFQVHHASNIFGCIGAINAKYCILNKQYLHNKQTESPYKNSSKGETLSPIGFHAK